MTQKIAGNGPASLCSPSIEFLFLISGLFDQASDLLFLPSILSKTANVGVHMLTYVEDLYSPPQTIRRLTITK